MRIRVGRVVLAAACLSWLAGCQTVSNSDNPFVKLGETMSAPSAAPADPETTGSLLEPAPPALPPATPFGSPGKTPELLGTDPNDDLSIGKKYFRQGSYGLAERHFRRAVEQHPRDAEAWVGLAAAYDRLKRFDLADRAYGQAVKLVGPTPEIMNNQGFSFMLRGDYGRARSTLLAAQAKAPQNPYIANNLRMLDESAAKAKAIN